MVVVQENGNVSSKGGQGKMKMDLNYQNSEVGKTKSALMTENASNDTKNSPNFTYLTSYELTLHKNNEKDLIKNLFGNETSKWIDGGGNNTLQTNRNMSSDNGLIGAEGQGSISKQRTKGASNKIGGDMINSNNRASGASLEMNGLLSSGNNDTPGTGNQPESNKNGNNSLSTTKNGGDMSSSNSKTQQGDNENGGNSNSSFSKTAGPQNVIGGHTGSIMSSNNADNQPLMGNEIRGSGVHNETGGGWSNSQPLGTHNDTGTEINSNNSKIMEGANGIGSNSTSNPNSKTQSGASYKTGSNKSNAGNNSNRGKYNENRVDFNSSNPTNQGASNEGYMSSSNSEVLEAPDEADVELNSNNSITPGLHREANNSKFKKIIDKNSRSSGDLEIGGNMSSSFNRTPGARSDDGSKISSSISQALGTGNVPGDEGSNAYSNTSGPGNKIGSEVSNNNSKTQAGDQGERMINNSRTSGIKTGEDTSSNTSKTFGADNKIGGNKSSTIGESLGTGNNTGGVISNNNSSGLAGSENEMMNSNNRYTLKKTGNKMGSDSDSKTSGAKNGTGSDISSSGKSSAGLHDMGGEMNSSKSKPLAGGKANSNGNSTGNINEPLGDGGNGNNSGKVITNNLKDNSSVNAGGKGKGKGKIKTIRKVTKRKRLPFRLVQIFFNRSRRVSTKVATYNGLPNSSYSVHMFPSNQSNTTTERFESKPNKTSSDKENKNIGNQTISANTTFTEFENNATGEIGKKTSPNKKTTNMKGDSDYSNKANDGIIKKEGGTNNQDIIKKDNKERTDNKTESENPLQPGIKS